MFHFEFCVSPCYDTSVINLNLMSLTKQAKDYVVKLLNGKDFVPAGLVEINRYFRLYEPVRFDFKQENGTIIAISQNFRYGSIITSGRNEQELDKNIKDAILTSFSIPSCLLYTSPSPRDS